MKLGDLPLGLLAGLFGLVVILEAARFPEMAGMEYGPEFFPILVGGGFCLCGLVLMVKGLRARLAGDPLALFALEPGLKQPKPLLRAVAVLATVIAFVLLVKPLGFILSLAVLLFLLLRCLAAGWIVSFVLALAMPFALHFCFTTFLRVPLPRGFVEKLFF